MKLLVIGNSHCNMVRHAADAPGGLFKDDLTFLVAPGSDLQLAVNEGVVRCLSGKSVIVHASGVSQPDVVMADYDAVVVVGLNIICRHILRLHDPGFRLTAYSDESTTPLSLGAYVAAMTGALESCLGIRAAMLLRRHTSLPIVLVPQPMSVVKLRDEAPKSDYHRELIRKWQIFLDDENMGAELERVFNLALQRVARVYDFQLALQPAETRDGLFSSNIYELLTVSPFAGVSERLLPREDYTHLNAAYGAVVLAQLKAMLTPGTDAVAAADWATAMTSS